MFFLLLVLTLTSLTMAFFSATAEMFLYAALLSLIAWAMFALVVRGIFGAVCRGKGPLAALPLMFASRPRLRSRVGLTDDDRPDLGLFSLLGIPFAAWFWSLRFTVLVSGNYDVAICNVIYLWGELAFWFQCGGQTVFLLLDLLLLLTLFALFWGGAVARYFSSEEFLAGYSEMSNRSKFMIGLFERIHYGEGGGPIRRFFRRVDRIVGLPAGVAFGWLLLHFLFSLVVSAMGSFPDGAEIEVGILFLIFVGFSVPMFFFWTGVALAAGRVMTFFAARK